MSTRMRTDWSRRIDKVLHSQKYMLVAEGLSGEPIEKALTDITADIMHLCKRRGINLEQLLAQSRTQAEQEEKHAPAQASV